MHDYEIYIRRWRQNATLNKGRWIHRTPKIREICEIRVSPRFAAYSPKCDVHSDDMDLTSLQQEHSKNVTLSAKLFFFTTERWGKMSMNPYGHWVPVR